MSDLKPVNCGCGGEATQYGRKKYWVECRKCRTQTDIYDTKAEAVEAWNKSMSGSKHDCAKDARCTERTAKVIEHDASVTDTDGYKYHRSEYLCGACKKKVLGGDEYCSHCGCRLDWNEDIPMEYFESGGK